MRKIYLLVIATFVSVNAVAQNPSFTWAKAMGGSGTDVGNAITTDASGNVYCTGNYNGSADFDPGPGVFTLAPVGSVDAFITKVNAAGNFLWAKSIGGTSFDVAYSIAVDAAGNSYVTGYFSSTVDFDPGPGVYNLTSSGGADIFVLKLDGSGNFVWAKQMGGSDANGDVAYDIALDNSGNIYTTGYYYGTGDFDPGVGVFNLTAAGSSDIFISKMDASGNFVWAKSIGGSSGFDNARSITVDNLMNVYITGAYVGIVDFDPGAGVFNLTGVSGTDIYVCKLNSLGNFVWAKGMGGNNTDTGTSIAVDNSFNVFSTGYFASTVVDFDPGPGVNNFTLVGNDNAYVSKLDVNGTFVWARQFGGGTANTEGYGIKLDASGNVITVGYFSNVTDFDPGPGVASFTAPANQREIFINKLDGSGNFIWNGQAGGTGDDLAFDVALDANNIYLTGRFQNTVDFDPGLGTYTIASFGAWDCYVEKLGNCTAPSQPGSISGLNSMCSGAGATNYSIATVAGATSYSWSLPAGWSGASSGNTISATPGSSGIFTVTANNACGAGPQQTLNVIVNPLPTVSVNSGSICAGQNFTITPGGANTYTIQGGNAVVSPTANASFTVIGTSTAGCISSSAAVSNVTVNPLPNVSAASSTNQLCIGSTATLSASGASSYTWNPGGISTSITISPTVNTTYTITGASASGCINTSIITQTVINCSVDVSENNVPGGVIVSPNPTYGKFQIKGLNGEFRVEVYTAMGELISLNFDSRAQSTMPGNSEADLSELPSGIYFLRIGSQTIKIVKQ